MSVRILSGHVLDKLAEIAPNSVQVCVTSPPFYGLRNYGTPPQTWPDGWVGELGQEETLSRYLDHLLMVFDAVRRVLRDDGCLFVNLGDSYASAQSRPLPRESACGNDGTEQSDYRPLDSAYLGLCDGCRDSLSRRTVDSIPPLYESALLQMQKGRDTERLDSSLAFPDALPLAARESTKTESGRQPSALCSHCANCDACLSVLRSGSRDARLCVRNSAYSYGIDSPLEPLVARTSGTVSSGKAWGEPPIVHPQYTAFKPKDLMLIPHRFAIAMQDAGWWVRNDLVWAKTACMPESVTDRATRSHEYIFHFAKSSRYYYDAEAVKEPTSLSSDFGGTRLAVEQMDTSVASALGQRHRMRLGNGSMGDANGRNQRTVWTIRPEPLRDEHYAAWPTEIPRRCILAGSKPGDTVIDPFIGSGRTGIVADRLGRHCIGIELSPANVQMSERLIRGDSPMFADVEVA